MGEIPYVELVGGSKSLAAQELAKIRGILTQNSEKVHLECCSRFTSTMNPFVMSKMLTNCCALW